MRIVSKERQVFRVRARVHVPAELHACSVRRFSRGLQMFNRSEVGIHTEPERAVRAVRHVSQVDVGQPFPG